MRHAMSVLMGLLILGLLGCGSGNDDDDNTGSSPPVEEGWTWTIDVYQLGLPGGTLMKERTRLPGAIWNSGVLQRGYVVQQHPVDRPRTELRPINPNCWMVEPDVDLSKAGVPSDEQDCPCAGTLRMTVGDQLFMALSPGSGGLYLLGVQKPAPWRVWEHNQLLMLQAEGKEIPPFDLALNMPAAASITGIVMRQGLVDGLPSIRRGQDLQLFWQPQVGRLAIGFEQDLTGDSEGPALIGLCSFAGLEGRGELPARLLQQFSLKRSTRMVAYRLAEAVQTSGSADIRLRIFSGEAREVVLR